ncbi:MAG: hypothetical protein ABH952_08525 [Candidatus Omnitrophota bacterium]
MTKTEFKKRYVAELIRLGWTKTYALKTYAAGISSHDYDEDENEYPKSPEDQAYDEFYCT